MLTLIRPRAKSAESINHTGNCTEHF